MEIKEGISESQGDQLSERSKKKEKKKKEKKFTQLVLDKAVLLVW